MKTVVILGMHRSGTSMVSGILKRLGVDVGKDILGAVVSNPFGHFENIQFLNMNERILKSCGGDWTSPPPVENILNQKKIFSDEIKKLVQKNQSDVWGWKDPRTSLTIELYLSHLKNPYFLICHRNEIDIAKSLNRRNGMSIKEGLELIKIYNKRIDNFLKKYQGLKKYALHYDEIRKNPSKELKKIINFLDISPTSEEFQKTVFFVASDKKKQLERIKYLAENPLKIIDVFKNSILKRRNNK